MNFHSDASTLPSVRQARRLPAGTTLPSRAGEPGAAEEGPGLHTPRGGSGSAALSSPRRPARGPMNQRSVSAGAAPSRRRGQGGRQRRAGCATAPAAPRGRRRRRPLRARRRRAARGERGPGPSRGGSAGAAAASPGCGSRSPPHSFARSSGRRSAARCHGSGRREGERERACEQGGEGAEGGRDFSLLQLLPAGGNLLHPPPPPPPARRSSRSSEARGDSAQPDIPGGAGTAALRSAPRLPPRGLRFFPRPSPSRRRCPAVTPQSALRTPGYGGSELSLQVDASVAAIAAESESANEGMP